MSRFLETTMNREIPRAAPDAVTPTTYASELFAVSWAHKGEATFAVSWVIVVVLTALGIRASLYLQGAGGTLGLLFVLLPSIVAVLLLETAVAAWRLHRRQQIVMETRQTLLDLNAADLAELEGHLLARYRRRERRIGARNEARVQRLDGEIAALNAR